MFPLATFDRIENATARQLATQWGHYLGGCNRPFGVQSFGLYVAPIGLVSVAVSASIAGPTCDGIPRMECVELARLVTHPDERWATRVCLRLWRHFAPDEWTREQWPVKHLVSYSDKTRHKGDVYRFDGWRKGADVRGRTSVGGRQKGAVCNPKSVWVFDLTPSPVVSTGETDAS
jgi:hypothetical protein